MGFCPTFVQGEDHQWSYYFSCFILFPYLKDGQDTLEEILIANQEIIVEEGNQYQEAMVVVQLAKSATPKQWGGLEIIDPRTHAYVMAAKFVVALAEDRQAWVVMVSESLKNAVIQFVRRSMARTTKQENMDGP